MAARKSKTANCTFTTWHEDDEGRPVEVTIAEGDKLPADHPVVLAHQEFFNA